MLRGIQVLFSTIKDISDARVNLIKFITSRYAVLHTSMLRNINFSLREDMQTHYVKVWQDYDKLTV